MRFGAMPLVAILRGQRTEIIAPVVQALTEGGFTALEITMNSPAAIDQIRLAVALAKDHLTIGAGTVTKLAELDAAQAAGAGFIVTPAVVPEVISECIRRGLPVFPGAFTPTEILQAHCLGATMVKLFPAHRLGSDYLRDLKAPLPHVQVLATGGITPDNLPEFVNAGADGFGIGSQLFEPDRLDAKDWAWLKARAAQYCVVWGSSRCPKTQARD